MAAIYTFIACFGLVFALAFQSLNTNQGRHGWAFITSFVIGAAQLYVLRTLPSTEDLLVQAAYLAGGPFGAIAAMRWHPWITKNRKRGNINCGADRP